MKTNTKFLKLIKDKIITEEILELCLYSVNKRAKNCRDKKAEYRDHIKSMRYFNHYYYDKYDNIDKYNNKMNEYYDMKDILLSILDPVCIHEEHQGYERVRIFDYEEEYDEVKDEDVIWSNSFYDYDRDEEVFFVDILDKESPKIRYYKYYKTTNYSFHSPIDVKDLKEFPDKEIVEIDTLETEGKQINSLISVQFVKKVIDLIKDKDYKYITEKA